MSELSNFMSRNRAFMAGVAGVIALGAAATPAEAVGNETIDAVNGSVAAGIQELEGRFSAMARLVDDGNVAAVLPALRDRAAEARGKLSALVSETLDNAPEGLSKHIMATIGLARSEDTDDVTRDLEFAALFGDREALEGAFEGFKEAYGAYTVPDASFRV